MIKNFIILLIPGSLLLSCSGSKPDQKEALIDSGSFKIKYAEGFKIFHKEKCKLVEVTYPYQGATSGYRYLLVQKGASIPPHDSATQVIYVPLDNIVCTSTTHIPLLDYLGETRKLIGFPTTDYISS